MKAPTTNWIYKRLADCKEPLQGLADKMCDKQVLSAFCTYLRLACNKKKLEPEQLAALEQSTDHLLNQVLTQELIDANAYRVLANWHFIMEGMAIPVWNGERTDADVLFLGVSKQRVTANNKLYLQVELKLRTGLAAGIITCGRFTPRQISYFLSKHSGTKKLNCAIEEISGMKASLVVEMQGDELSVVDWRCTQDQRAYNRKLAEARRDVRKCSTFIPCNTCPQTIKECSLAIWLPEEVS